MVVDLFDVVYVVYVDWIFCFVVDVTFGIVKIGWILIVICVYGDVEGVV